MGSEAKTEAARARKLIPDSGVQIMSNFFSSAFVPRAIRRMTTPPPAPVYSPPPPPRPTASAALAATPGQQAQKVVEPGTNTRAVSGPKKKSKTVYTSTLGLSTADKSGATNKVLTGQ